MSYRTPAERDGDAPPDAPPVRVLMLERYLWWHVALVLGGLAFVFAFSALVPYSLTEVSCTRSDAEPDPVCEVAQRSELHTSRVNFRLTPGALAARTDIDSDHDRATFLVVTSNKKIPIPASESWAKRVVAEAEAFRASTRASWHADDHSPLLRYGLLALAALVLLAYPFQRMRTRIELDVAKEEIRFTRLAYLLQPDPQTWRANDVERARLSDDSDGTPWVALVVDDNETKVAPGRRESVEAGVAAIEGFLDGLRKARTQRVASSGNTSDLFADWANLTDEEKWDRTELLLGRVPVDAERILRRIPEDVVDLRGKQGGFLFHIQIDPTAPENFELELAARQPMGDIDLTLNPAMSFKNDDEGRTFVAEHVYIGDPEETASFRALPEELQAAIVNVMEHEDLEHFRIGPKIIEVAGETLVMKVEDPVAHLTRVLDAAVATATYLSALPFPAGYDDHHADSGNFRQGEEDEEED